MKLFTVIENTCGKMNCAYEHGLCIYVETKKHKLLFDTGATSAFAQNANVLGIDLRHIDTVILSHGHYDHGGGILEFRRYNGSAPVFMQKKATEEYYNKERYIGLDKQISKLPGVHFLDGNYRIDEELFLFSGIKGRRLWPQSNRTLGRVLDGERIQDDFAHEQCMALSADGYEVLLSGCAHNGILNILEEYKNLFRRTPNLVVSGFHMMKKTEYDAAEIADIEETARELQKTDALFYTGHCTGQRAYEIMHRIMGDQLRLMHSGEEIVI